MFVRYGLPQEIRCDRGREFAGEVTDLCKKYKIKRIVAST